MTLDGKEIYKYDILGSITHVIPANDFVNGDVNSRILCRYDYDAFGNTINAEDTITNGYGFTGEMHDTILLIQEDLHRQIHITETG